MNKARLEAFTDAIVAIIVTVLVLELPKPADYSLDALLVNWKSYLAYMAAFFLIVGVWYQHHNLYKHADTISRPAFWVNAIWMLLQSFIPYLSSWMGEYPDHTLPIAIFVILCILWTFSYRLMYHVLKKDNPAMPPYPWRITLAYIISMLIILLISFYAPLLAITAIAIISIVGLFINPGLE